MPRGEGVGVQQDLFGRIDRAFAPGKNRMLESSCFSRATISSYSAFSNGLLAAMQRSRYAFSAAR
jgi:hypothetical protein